MTADHVDPQRGFLLPQNKRLPIAHPETLRRTQYGDIIGSLHCGGCYVWQGIPYARPPLGAYRWRAPQSLSSWQGVYSALEPGPASAQLEAYAKNDQDILIGDEDCLYLNIWTPPYSTNQIPQKHHHHQLPVMVWIHGGSNIRGQGSTFLAGTLATTQNVIVVTINYRLGALGWFRHPSLRAIAANEEDRSGNYGLLDIIAALAWLRENISAFGGNAQKITIIGESAGAWNVCALLVSPKASGLFHRAIIQSGSIVTFDPQASENYTDDTIAGDPQSTGELLLQLILRDKLAKDRDGAKAAVAAMSDRKIAEYLREKSPLDLEKIYQKIRLDNQLSVLQFPVLFRDGVVLPATGIDNALVAGEFNKVPVIFGATKDEYTLLLTLSPNTPFIQKDRNSIGIKIQDRKQFNRAVHYLNLFFKMASVYEPINRITRFQPNQSFAYSFNWNYLLPAPLMDNIELGATHGIDVIFLFGKENVGPEFLQVPLIDGQFIGSYQKLSNAVMSYWAAFADSGNPGCGRKGELPLWEHWCPNQAAGAMILDDPEKGGLRMDHHPLRKADVFRELASDSFFSSAYSRNEFLQNIHTIGMRFSLINKLDYTNFCAFAHADGTRHK